MLANLGRQLIWGTSFLFSNSMWYIYDLYLNMMATITPIKHRKYLSCPRKEAAWEIQFLFCFRYTMYGHYLEQAVKKCFWVNAFGAVFDKFSRKGFKISSGIFHALKNESARGPCGGTSFRVIIEILVMRCVTR